MPVMRRAEIVDRKGEMELIVAEIVRLVPVAQPGQLELVRRRAVRQVDDGEAAVLGVDAADLLEAECLILKFERTLKIADVEVIVRKTELHNSYLRCIFHIYIIIFRSRTQYSSSSVLRFSLPFAYITVMRHSAAKH